MKEAQLTPGIEVEEQEIGNREIGFLEGVFAAWGIVSPDDNEYRDAISLLIARKHGTLPVRSQRPDLRLVPTLQPVPTPAG